MDGDYTPGADRGGMRELSLPPEFTPRRGIRRFGSWRWASFIAVAMLPAAIVAAYTWGFAADQYVSEFRFSVRQSPPMPVESNALAQGLTSGTSLLAAAMDSQIVVQYIKSHQIIDDLHGRIDLDAIYHTDKADALARLPAAAPAEERLRYWRTIVDPYFDLSTGLVAVKVRAFTPADAQQVASAVLSLSEALVNRLSLRARQDRLGYTDADVAAQEARFRRAELALGAYRNAHAIVFPEMHATENATLDTGLSQQLAQSRAEFATLQGRGLSPQSPQLRLLSGHIAALQAQLETLQSQLANPAAPAARNLASVLSGYDELQVEDQISQRAYERSVSLQQQARGEAAQQQVYLNAFVQPDLPEESLYPQRWRLVLETLLTGCAVWCLGSLLIHGVREHLH